MESRIHYRACTLCEAICGLEIKVEAGAITSIRGDTEDPLSQGHICPKAVALQDLQSDPDRLRRPLRKTAEGWQEIPWDEAFEVAISGLRRVQDRAGADAVAAYVGNPNVHSFGNLLFLPGLLRSLGSRNLFSATSADQLPHHLASYFVFGHGFLLPVPDLDRSDLLVVFGANPAVSNGSMMSAPGMRRRLKALRQRGGRLVVFDPRRTETAKLADEHYFLRPGSDALVLAALVQTLFAEGRVDLAHLADHVTGLADLEAAVAGFTPEAVAAASGVEAVVLRRLARQLAAAPSAAVYGRLGTSVQSFGTTCQWLLIALNLLTGNLDREGGAMFPLPAFELVRSSPGQRNFDRWRSRVRNLPEYGGELPVATLADEITTPGPGQVKALLTVAGNPVLSTPNGKRLEEALEGLELMIAVDFYLNETTRHADLILPPTAPLERDHYDVVFNAMAVRDVARYSAAVFEPPPGALHDWQILHRLRLGLDRGLSTEARQKLEWKGSQGPRGILALGLDSGPYGAAASERPGGSPQVDFAALQQSVHGIDLGPLKAGTLTSRLRSTSGCIELAPEQLIADLDRLAAEHRGMAAGGTVLIGRRHVRSNNSWMHNSSRLMRGKARCTLLVHPRDAARFDLRSGQGARVESARGSLVAEVEVSDEIMPGVVSLPHGWGHGRSGTRLAVANATPGVSVNDLTDEGQVDEVSGNAVLNGVPVTLAPA
ncbi:MAG: molybdopterin oxidoreductase family protein [Acidobacteriota bacterium]